MPILYILNGPGKGRSFEITPKSLFIGRDTDNDIQVQDPSVSRKHAKVFQKDSKVFIEDLRSQNGTWIDGAALKSGESYELAEGFPPLSATFWSASGRLASRMLSGVSTPLTCPGTSHNKRMKV